MKYTGVTSRGVILPIFRQGDDLISVTCDAIMEASKQEGFTIEDGDIIGVTESVVARTQGNYATVKQMSEDIRRKFGGGSLGIVFPILSRNRFSVILKAIAMACDKLYVQLAYPSDEVGNCILTHEQLDEKDVHQYTDSFDEKQFRNIFGNSTLHPFTGIDYVEYYKSMGANIEILFSNDPAYVLNYTKNVLCCDIHTRTRTKQLVQKAGAEKVFALDEILSSSVDGSGYNEQYGLLGSNLSTEESIKLFPRNCQPVVDSLQAEMKKRTGKTVEVLIYGDGCFKDPVGGIWELADPVVAPAYTKGLSGTPNEIKMKYFADNELGSLEGEELAEALREKIRHKDSGIAGEMTAQGTTPRRYVDLIGSLCDLTSGSGDRGTPVVYIKGYFTNYAG